MNETIAWQTVDDPSDADITVLLLVGGESWPGWLDEDNWRSDSGGRCEPTHWAEMPQGPAK